MHEQLQDVQDISSTNDAFAALKSDGTVISWGDSRNGGDSSAVQDTGSARSEKIWDPDTMSFVMST